MKDCASDFVPELDIDDQCDPDDPHQASACRALYRQIIVHAMREAFGVTYGATTRNTRKRLRAEALDWFDSRDFSTTCALAGLDDGAVRAVFDGFVAVGALPKRLSDLRGR